MEPPVPQGVGPQPVELWRALILHAAAEVEGRTKTVVAGAGHGREARPLGIDALLLAQATIGVPDAHVAPEPLLVGGVEPVEGTGRVSAQHVPFLRQPTQVA